MAAIFSQIDGSNAHKAQHHSTQTEPKPQTYRHDENILEGKPVIFKQIIVPQHGGKDYCRDSGLVFPNFPYKLHKCLLEAAERWGLTPDHRLKIIGVCGPNSKQTHSKKKMPTRGPQWSCGSCVGPTAQGISCGRPLANHEVDVILFLPGFVMMEESVTSEVRLYSRMSGLQVANVKELLVSPVNLVINCHEKPLLREQSWYQSAADWANRN